MVEGSRTAGDLVGTIAAVCEERLDGHGVLRTGTGLGSVVLLLASEAPYDGRRIRGQSGPEAWGRTGTRKREFVPIAIRNSAAIKMRLPNGRSSGCRPAMRPC